VQYAQGYEALILTNPQVFWDTSVHTLATMTCAWNGVIGRYGDADVNDNARLMLQLCCKNAMCITNTFFQQKMSTNAPGVDNLRGNGTSLISA